MLDMTGMKNRSKVRRKRWFMTAMMGLLALVSCWTHASPAKAASDDEDRGSILGGYATVPGVNEVASSRYAVIAQFKPGVSQKIITGVTPSRTVNGRTAVVDPSNSLKGRIKVLYTDVATYKGRSLDFEWTVSDWQKAGFRGGEYFVFYDNQIGFSLGGYDYVKLDGTYKYSDTGQPATDLTGSYMTVNDLDANQFMAFDSSMMSRIDKMYAYANSWVNLWHSGSKTNIGARFHEALDSDDKRGFVTFLVSGYQFNFEWHKDWSRPSSDNLPYNKNRVLDWYNEASNQYFSYKSEKPVPTEVLTPTKKIENSSGNYVNSNNVTVPETFTYDIFHTVPNEYPEFFYRSYVMEDTVHKALDIVDVKVYDNRDKNVTSKFDISTSGRTVRATATSSSLNSKSFYGNDYRFAIKVRTRNSPDMIAMSKSLGNGKSFSVTNTATTTIDGKSKNTNTVTTKITMPAVDLGLKSIEIYTDKAANGLPTNVATSLKDYLSMYADETFDVTLYQRTKTNRHSGGSGLKTKVAMKTLSLKDNPTTIAFKVPSSYLQKGSAKDYVAEISNYDPNYVEIASDAKAIDTHGYASVEGTLTEKGIQTSQGLVTEPTSDNAENGEPEKGTSNGILRKLDANRGLVKFASVVYTKRALGGDIVPKFETLTVNYTPSQRTKSGYGVNLYGEMAYTNEKPASGINKVTDATMQTDKPLLDKTLPYYNSDAVPLENKTSTASSKVYQAPKVWLEQRTNNSYTSSRANSVAGGNKLYVPTWIETLGVYNIILKNNSDLGTHHMNFAMTGKIDVYAFMFSHMDSGTPDDDELMIHPMEQEKQKNLFTNLFSR